MYYLGIDLGTSNIKTLLMDGACRVIESGETSVIRSEQSDGAVEQDISQIYSALCDAIKQIVTKYSPEKIVSIGISSQGGAILPLSDNITPAGKVISWLDTRGEKYNNRLTEKLGSEFFALHTGYFEAIMFPGQFLRLKTEQPEFFAGIKQWGFVGDVIVGMLTGRRVHDFTSLSISGLLNPYEKRADTDLLNELGVDEEQLPTLQNAFSVAGSINKKTAAETGLADGTPVSPAVHDQYAAAIAANVMQNGDVMLATGTAWVLVAVTDKMQNPITPKAFSCPHPVDGLYGQMVPLGTGGSIIEWAMKTIGHENVTTSAVDEFLKKADQENKFKIDPILETGVGTTEIPMNDKPKNLIYTVVLGLANQTLNQLNLMKHAGMEVKRLILTGPASQSEIIPSIITKITGLKVDCFTESAASAYGAALIAKKINES